MNKPTRMERREFAMSVVTDLGLKLITAKKYKIPTHHIVIDKNNDMDKVNEAYRRIEEYSKNTVNGYGIGWNPTWGARWVIQKVIGNANIGSYDSKTALGYCIELG